MSLCIWREVIPVSFIRKCVDLLLVRLIIQTLRQEGRCDFDFVSVWNSMCLCVRIDDLFVFVLCFLFYIVEHV